MLDDDESLFMLTLKSNLCIEISYLVLFERRENKLNNNEKVTLLVKKEKKMV